MINCNPGKLLDFSKNTLKSDTVFCTFGILYHLPRPFLQRRLSINKVIAFGDVPRGFRPEK